MNNKGFTLIELLVVIVILSVVSVSSTIAFTEIDNATDEADLINKYISIQRSASMYFDFEAGGMEQLVKFKSVKINLNTLKELNYISDDLTNPVTNDTIPGYYYVKFIIDNSSSKVDTCIIDYDLASNEICIANSEGVQPKSGENCCG